jgi:hypothetical protein
VLPEHEFFGTSTSTISSIQQENIDVAAPTFFSQQLNLGSGSFKLDSGCGTDQGMFIRDHSSHIIKTNKKSIKGVIFFRIFLTKIPNNVFKKIKIVNKMIS